MREMKKQIRYALYVIIITVCLFAVFVGVYNYMYRERQSAASGGDYFSNETQENTQAEVVDNFKSLFNNTFEGNENNLAVQKLNQDEQLVYSAISFQQKEDNKYEMNLNIPVININSELANKYNENTQNLLVAKANQIILETQQENATEENITNSEIENTTDNEATNTQNGENTTIYEVKYTSYLNGDILSVGIMASLKEGTKAQAVMIQTYNYNIATGKEVLITDILNNRGLEENAVNKKIKTVIEQLASDANSVASSGYNVLQRDLNDEIYNIKNVQTFIQGPDGELYIIYAYGNATYTSEMDIIKI